ncbi:MAG: hypothetical protein NVS3B20_08430 [Polyangiales bacterium]
MLCSMSRPYPLVVFSAVMCSLLAGGCNSDAQNGQDCLRSDDCASKRCVAHVCIQPGAGQSSPDATPSSDAVNAVDAADAAAGADAIDSSPAESASADSGGEG